MLTRVIPPDRPPARFRIEELVSRRTFKRHGVSSLRFIDRNIFTILNAYVQRFPGKKIYANTWPFQNHDSALKPFEYRGYREPECTEGAKESAHRRGMAIDLDVEDVSSLEVQKIIKAEFEKFWRFFGLTGIEDGTVGWTHNTCETWGTEELKLISIPK